MCCCVLSSLSVYIYLLFVCVWFRFCFGDSSCKNRNLFPPLFLPRSCLCVLLRGCVLNCCEIVDVGVFDSSCAYHYCLSFVHFPLPPVYTCSQGCVGTWSVCACGCTNRVYVVCCEFGRGFCAPGSLFLE